MEQNVISDLENKSEPSAIVVRVSKFDGAVHKSWPARLVRRVGQMLELVGEFDREIEHSQLGTIECGTVSSEYYWLDRWYSIFRFSMPSGALRNYYCNINTPPKFEGNVLSYVDLDVDILVSPNHDYSILDEDEFLENSKRFAYPIDVLKRVNNAKAELISKIETRQFPFDEDQRFQNSNRC